MRQSTVCVAFLLLAAAASVRLRDRPASLSSIGESATQDEFHRWMVEHNKVYATSLARRRAFSTFVHNAAVIEQLNANPEDTAVYGHTKFSDMMPEDFRRMYFGFEMDPKKGKVGAQQVVLQQMGDIPDSFDWRDKNAVTPVKDQGSCGCCWADSAVQNVESVQFIHGNMSGSPQQLSVEQVIECDAYDYACYGGYPSHAFHYMIDAGGLATEASYPFDVSGHVICLANQTFNETCGDGICDDPPLTGFCDLTCSDNNHTIAASISSFISLPEDETQIAQYVATTNPVSVALDASGRFALMPWLQFYKSGVANPKHCSTTTLDHAVLIVGYGVDGSTPYWTVKNSWGEKWGESGYFRIVRGEGKCGINTMVTSAVL